MPVWHPSGWYQVDSCMNGFGAHWWIGVGDIHLLVFSIEMMLTPWACMRSPRGRMARGKDLGLGPGPLQCLQKKQGRLWRSKPGKPKSRSLSWKNKLESEILGRPPTPVDSTRPGSTPLQDWDTGHMPHSTGSILSSCFKIHPKLPLPVVASSVWCSSFTWHTFLEQPVGAGTMGVTLNKNNSSQLPPSPSLL